MEYCHECGSVTWPKDGKLVCKNNHIQDITKSELKEKIVSNSKIEVIDQEVHSLATYDHTCSKCGFKKAQLISKGIWCSDEDEVMEFVCGKCGFHERTDGAKVL